MNTQFSEQVVDFLPLQHQIPLSGALGIPLRGLWTFSHPGGAGWAEGGWKYMFGKNDLQFQNGYMMDCRRVDNREGLSALFWPRGGGELQTWFDEWLDDIEIRREHPRINKSEFERKARDFYGPRAPRLYEWIGIIQHKISLNP